MAATKSSWLELSNDVLRALNEVEMTSISAGRGIQKTAYTAVNDAVRDLINAELEWPFNINSTTQALTIGIGADYSLPTGYRSVDMDSFHIKPTELLTNNTFDSDITSWTDISAGSGTAAHTSDGNGRCRLTGDGTDIGGINQSISTVVGKVYRLTFQHYVGDVSLNIGTTSNGGEIVSTTVALANAGQGEWHDDTFTATATTTHISLSTTSTTAIDIDQIYCHRDIRSQHLKYDKTSLDRRRVEWKILGH